LPARREATGCLTLAATRLKFAARLCRSSSVGPACALNRSTDTDFLLDPNLIFRLERRFGSLTFDLERST
jgi:hypothetical protein